MCSQESCLFWGFSLGVINFRTSFQFLPQLLLDGKGLCNTSPKYCAHCSMVPFSAKATLHDDPWEINTSHTVIHFLQQLYSWPELGRGPSGAPQPRSLGQKAEWRGLESGCEVEIVSKYTFLFVTILCKVTGHLAPIYAFCPLALNPHHLLRIYKDFCDKFVIMLSHFP